MKNISKEAAMAFLKKHLIETAIKQAGSLKIEESEKLPVIWNSISPEDEQGPEDYYCIRFPNENPSARHMLDGYSRYILISKITGQIMADGWGR